MRMSTTDVATSTSFLVDALFIKSYYDGLLRCCEQLDELRGTWLWTDELCQEIEGLQMAVADLGGDVATLLAVARLAKNVEPKNGLDQSS